MATLCRLLLVSACLVAAAGLFLVFEQYPYLFFFLLLVAAWKRTRQVIVSISHGSARMASLFTLMRAGLHGHDKGWILGRASLVNPPTRLQAFLGLLTPWASSESACRTFLASIRGQGDSGLVRVRDGVHALTTAPSGAGKSVSVLLPNLLSLPDSCVCVDPKGELFKLTAKHRDRHFGHQIVRIDPFGIGGPATESACLNPFIFIDERQRNFLDDCKVMADLLVLRMGNETDPHWNSRAIDVLATFIAFTCACEVDPAHRSLVTVRNLLASPHSFRAVLKKMQETEGYEGVLSLLGHNLEWIKGRELGSVLSTVSRHINWMQSPPVADCLSKSTFLVDTLLTGKVTVYLILPQEMLKIYGSLMRLWLGTLLNRVTRHGASEKHKVLFFVDEAATLGYMEPIKIACTLLRGYGIRLWLFFQSLEQIKTCYGTDASTILANTGTQQYFGTTLFETADDLSKRIGDTTILVESINHNRSMSRPTGHLTEGGNFTYGGGVTISEQTRRLLKPEEILMLPRDVGLVFHNNLPVIPVELVKHYRDSEFADGGTGKSRRLGVGAVLLSAFLLAFSVVFASLLTALPSPDMLRQAALAPASPQMARMMRQTVGSPYYRPVAGRYRTYRR